MKDIAASIRARLLNIAHAEGKSNQLILTRYFQERLLFRISRSPYADHFCLKGGVLLYVYQQGKNRPTKDLDLLGRRLASSFENLEQVFRSICQIPYEPDGIDFDQNSIAISEIMKEGDYQGVRVNLIGKLGSAAQKIQVDVGFGDVVVPEPVTMLFPVLLDLEAPNIYAYSIESVIAEKFHAMIERSTANSRMKDFYDVYTLFQLEKVRPSELEAAVLATFRNRETVFTEQHALFDHAFTNDAFRLGMWSAFLRKSGLLAIDFQDVMQVICERLQPIYRLLK